MTLQVEFWTVVSFLLTFMGVCGRARQMVVQ